MSRTPSPLWPLWASRSYRRDELAEKLELTPRTLRRAVSRGDVERLDGEQGAPPLYRLRDTPWTREQLERVGEDSGEDSGGDTRGGQAQNGGDMSPEDRGGHGSEASEGMASGTPAMRVIEGDSGEDRHGDRGEDMSPIAPLRAELHAALEREREHLLELGQLRAENAALVHRVRELEQGQLSPFARLMLWLYAWIKRQLP